MLHAQRSINFLIRIFPLKFSLFPVAQTRLFTVLSVHSSLLNLCKKPEHLQQVHARFILYGLHQYPTLCSKLIDCYANVGFLHMSKQIFNSLSDPDTLLYNTILRNLAKFGDFKNVLFMYQKMNLNSTHPDEQTYPFVLSSCSCSLDIVNGKAIHGHLIKLGFELFYLVDIACVEMHRNFDELQNKRRVIDRKSDNDNLNYGNSSVLEVSKTVNTKESFWSYERTRTEKIERDTDTVINLLRSTVDSSSLIGGKAIHCVILVCGLCRNVSVGTALLFMYSKLSSLADARLLFDEMPEKDCVVWNIIISAHSQNGYPQKSLEFLRYMGGSGVRADMFTALPAVSAIRKLKSLELGKEMHAHVIRNGSDFQVSVPNSLIDMYCECDCLQYAQKIFDLLENKTGASWSSMIKGYVNHDKSLDALSLFSKMKQEGPFVDFITVIIILPACVNVGALEQVKYLHGYSIKIGPNMVFVNTALLVSYAKCGCIEMARTLFDEEKISKDVIAWNSMINAYAKHGASSQCFELYNQMKQLNLEPNEITFLGLLTACVNAGLVKEGREIFKEMVKTYACLPRQEHYACMVDLLGRAGHVSEAREIVKTMPFKPDALVWGPLLSACKIHSDTKLAEVAAKELISIEPRNAGNYILLSNIYAAAGKWNGVAKMRSFLRDRGLKKTPGCSWLEVNGRVHEFHAADRSHPKADDIHTVLKNLELEIKETRNKFELTLLNSDFVHFLIFSCK
ncbi:pentatricopeptide repeat-containing protein At1g11290, chloroplastic-like [Jatropha curcas]|uniref:pentatricopeptide repeat-containing protein At1g11290, chloroplastic-like n=1 Tax=Jatropha curcas TaxID=180498 RepID=UPI0005FAE603|nr:pentatricopeptide repeat-containing protein At1g11290, chloroplastic-like [Jatropha curcas]